MNSIFSTLSPAQAVALNRANEPIANNIHHSNSGETQAHEGSLAVLIDYKFNVSANESYTPTINIPVKAVLALLSEESPEMAQKVISAMNEILTLKAKSEGGEECSTTRLKALMKDAPSATKNVDDMLATLPKSERKGKICNLELSIAAIDSTTVKTALVSHAEQEAQAALEQAKELSAFFA